MNNLAPFCHGSFYHVFNRTNNKELLFKEEDNYNYFLNLYQQFLIPYANTYSYALLGNHFHFSISVKSEDEIMTYLNNLDSISFTNQMRLYKFSDSKELFINKLISSQFRRLFISYTKAVNKRYHRDGSLFRRQFKRVLINSEAKFTWNQYYIHHNARKHQLVEDFKDYNYHSYFNLLYDHHTFLDRSYIMNWFGGEKSFSEFHNQELSFATI